MHKIRISKNEPYHLNFNVNVGIFKLILSHFWLIYIMNISLESIFRLEMLYGWRL